MLRCTFYHFAQEKLEITGNDVKPLRTFFVFFFCGAVSLQRILIVKACLPKGVLGTIWNLRTVEGT